MNFSYFEFLELEPKHRYNGLMDIILTNSDIFAIQADCFLSSGNVQLNMSGGVNGALLDRYGHSLQTELHAYLQENHVRQVHPGFVYCFQQPIQPYQMVLYAVSVDAWYNSTSQIVTQILDRALEIASARNLKSIVTCAFGTGYGKLKKSDYGRALRGFRNRTEIETMTICERNQVGLSEIQLGFAEDC